MAKAKKKELSLEEKLEQALVTAEEQPYEVPENWCWIAGKMLFREQESQKPQGVTFRYVDIDSIDNENQIVSEPKEMLVSKAPSRASRKLHKGDTVFSLVRPYLMNIAYIDETLSDCIASTGFYICSSRGAVDGRYLYHLMRSPYVVNGLNAFMKGDNSPSIRKNDIEDFVYPIPPSAEQQRIVKQIESLFAKLDEAKCKLNDIIELNELRRVAILHKAFRGELTKVWRREQGVSDSSWKNMTLGEVMKVSSGKSLTAKNMCEGDVPVYGGNGINGYHNESNIESDTLVIGRVGFYCGVVHHILEPAWVTDNGLIVKSNKNKFDNRFLYYLLSYTDLRQNDSSTAQPVVSGSKIYPLEVSIPDKEEQIQVAKIIDRLLRLEENINNQIIKVSNNIELMKRTILAKAFRGELGTNNPDEESAVELLKSIIEQEE